MEYSLGGVLIGSLGFSFHRYTYDEPFVLEMVNVNPADQDIKLKVFDASMAYTHLLLSP